MKEYTTKAFASAVPCSVATLANWRKGNIFTADHTNDSGYFVYTEEQLPAARALLAERTKKTAKEPQANSGTEKSSTAPAEAEHSRFRKDELETEFELGDLKERFDKANKVVRYRINKNGTQCWQIYGTKIVDNNKGKQKTGWFNVKPAEVNNVLAQTSGITLVDFLNIEEFLNNRAVTQIENTETAAVMDAPPADVQPENADETEGILGKKIMLEAPASSQQTSQNNHGNDSTNSGITQHLGRMPAEILALPRWLKTCDDNPKAPVGSKWQLPENQKPAAELNGIIGFVAATEADGGLIFYDLDHCLTEGETFVNAKAEMWFNTITQGGKFYAEKSQSKHGVHSFAVPTEGKFPKSTGRLYLTEDKTAFIEVFYGTNKFCLPTGDTIRCSYQDAPIAKGEVADTIFQAVLDAIAAQNAKAQPKQEETKEPARAQDYLPDNPEYDLWRAARMLDCIEPARLTDDNDWLAVISAAKNIGLPYAVIDSWNRRDPDRYNERENLSRWDSIKPSPDFDIETLHGIAKRFLYSESDTRREWHDMRGDNRIPESNTKEFRNNTKGKEIADLARADDGEVWTQDRIKSCPVNLRLPDNYIFSNAGIELVVHKKRGTDYICAAKAPIIPTKVFHNPLTGNVEYEFSILVFGKWTKVEVPAAVLGDRELTRILNGHGALIDKPQILNEFITAVIALNYDTLPRLKFYNQTGWTSEEFNDFAFPANGKSVVRREGYDYERILKPRGDREAWKEKFGEVVTQGGAAAKTIIGFACAAFLVRPLGLPNLQLHVHGRKSIGKTPTEQFAVSPFGNPTIHGLSYSFASTPKARLEMATAFRDFPMICEELESISKREAEKIPQDVYQFFMGTSGQALKKDGTRREQKNFSGTRLTSGEHSLVQSFGNAGEFKRVLELRCNSLLDEEFAADLYGFCAKNYGLFLEDWTRYIIEHQEQISKDYHMFLKLISAEQKDNGTEKDRTQLVTLIISNVAFQHFKVAIGLQRNIDCYEIEEVTKAVAKEMQSAEELDDTTRALAFLKSFVAGSDKYFARTITDTDTGTKRDICQYNADCYGKIFDSGDIAFLPHALKKILEEHGGFISAEKLINEFKSAGYLNCSPDKLTTYSCKIGGKAVRAIRFKADAFNEETAAKLVEVQGVKNYRLHDTGKM